MAVVYETEQMSVLEGMRMLFMMTDTTRHNTNTRHKINTGGQGRDDRCITRTSGQAQKMLTTTRNDNEAGLGRAHGLQSLFRGFDAPLVTPTNERTNERTNQQEATGQQSSRSKDEKQGKKGRRCDHPFPATQG